MNMMAVQGEALSCIEPGDFFAPAVGGGVIDSLLAEHVKLREKLVQIADMMSTENGAFTGAVGFFLDGNRDSHSRYAPSVAQLFRLDGAIAALNATYWAKALNLTDVMEFMPNDRRNEWNTIILERKTPEFEESAVRATLQDLIANRENFLAEKVDGIFRALSGAHVTNRPEGFRKRMIIAGVVSEYGTVEHRVSGYIHDLRSIIAKFMDRDEPAHSLTSTAVKVARDDSGEWKVLDGGALKLRCYKVGTGHIEVHPDIAWRLNAILAHRYPMAIPASHRQPPKRKAKDVAVIGQPLPFSVLHYLERLEPVRERISEWPERYRRIENARRFRYGNDCDKHIQAQAEAVIEAIGGVREHHYWIFDYEPEEALNEIQTSGCLPDQRSHQFYPTPDRLARKVIELAALKDGESVLEPSAGQGALAALLPADRTTCVEISALHCKILESKGFHVERADFLAWADGARRFDVAVMNPPFDRGRWKSHLQAASQIASRIVAILPSGARNTDPLPSWNCEWLGPFEREFPGTSISVVILKADRNQ